MRKSLLTHRILVLAREGHWIEERSFGIRERHSVLQKVGLGLLSIPHHPHICMIYI